MSLSASYTVSAAFVENLVWSAQQEGLDVMPWQQLLQGPHRHDTRLPMAVFTELWQALLAQTSDPLIGLRLGRHFRLGRWGLVEFFLLNARTVMDALQASASYWRLVADEEKAITLEQRPDGVRLLIQPRLLHPPAAFELDFCYVLRMMSLMLGQPTDRVSLGFAHAMPAGTTLQDYQQQLGSMSIAFKQSSYWLQVPQDMADSALPGAHPLIVQALQQQADLQLKLLDRPADLAGRVSQLIELGAADSEHVARQLGMSVRSLQRRLKEEGTGFAELRDDALRRRAEKLLGEPRMPLKEVAYFLGYEERGLFQACQRWFGASPGALRALWAERATP